MYFTFMRETAEEPGCAGEVNTEVRVDVKPHPEPSVSKDIHIRIHGNLPQELPRLIITVSPQTAKELHRQLGAILETK